jgi:hypothetical protein
MKTQASITGVLAKIQAKNLLNISQEHYSYATLFSGYTWMSGNPHEVQMSEKEKKYYIFTKQFKRINYTAQ